MTDWRRYDFHIHSRHSFDSLMRPARILELAMMRGLSGVAVTDHDSIKGGLEAREFAPDGMLVIVGEEIATDAGDIVGLFLTEEIRCRDPLEAIRQIHRQGGIAFLPHPGHGHRRITPAVIEAVQGWEELNSRAGWFGLDDTSVFAPLASRPRLGCSDAHLYSEIGRAFTEIPGPATEANVRARLLAGDTRPGGTVGSGAAFYVSQSIKLAKTRDAGMLLRGVRRLCRRALAGVSRQTSAAPRHPTDSGEHPRDHSLKP